MANENLKSTASQISNSFNAGVSGSTFTSSAAPLQTDIMTMFMPKNLQLPDWNTYLGSKEQRTNMRIQDNINKYGMHVDAKGIASKSLFENKGNYSYTNMQTDKTHNYNTFGQNKETGNYIGTTEDSIDVFSSDSKTKSTGNDPSGASGGFSNFMSSDAGQAVSAASNIVGGAVNAIGSSVRAYADRPDAQQLNETQESIRSAVYSGVSAIPGFGPLISAGLQLTDGLGKLMGTQMSNISKDAAEDAGLSRGFNNVVATIPGLGSVLGAFTKKADEFEIDRERLAGVGSAYDMSTFDSAEDLSGGLFLGQRDKVNDFIAEQNRLKDTMTSISDTQKLRKEGASAAAADLAQQNKNRYSGLTGGQMEIGKKGMKLDLSWARGLLSKFQKGGKTELKRRTLEELKAYADSVNPRFVQRMNDPNITGINFIDDNGNAAFGTHYMIYGYDDNGDYYVYPRIQEINGKLQFLDPDTAWKTAVKNKNYLFFGKNKDEAVNFSENYKKVYPVFQKFQKGGKLGTPGLESNVIVEGAYHAHKNHLDEVNPELSDMTPKGIPVATEDASGNKTQVAEIEVGELILTKDLTDKLEKLYKDGSDEAAIEAGMLFANEIIDNTVDNKGGVLDGTEEA